mmetsp:Transcript_45656/g.78898  ORF Transcript_45656/g.78898 Transcript_45656/m.78898 type:complete len:84 (+) Transcript_45656:982-1233(+)
MFLLLHAVVVVLTRFMKKKEAYIEQKSMSQGTCKKTLVVAQEVRGAHCMGQTYTKKKKKKKKKSSGRYDSWEAVKRVSNIEFL